MTPRASAIGSRTLLPARQLDTSGPSGSDHATLAAMQNAAFRREYFRAWSRSHAI
jgi:hypothetical protein